MRLFIGIEIPEVIKNEINNFLLPFQHSKKGWECAHDYHQTLLFIGESTEEECEEIRMRLDQIIFEPFDLETAEFKFFSRRIMYLDLNPAERLKELYAQIANLFPERIRPDEKKFVPHVTVKRWQRYEFEELKTGLDNRRLEPMKFTVPSVVLFKSEKDSENRKYHVLHRKDFISSGRDHAIVQLIP